MDFDLIIQWRSAIIELRRAGAWYMADVMENFVNEYIGGYK
jgi:hypothetical protein